MSDELSEKGRAFIRRVVELMDEGLTDAQVERIVIAEFGDGKDLHLTQDQENKNK